jgi:hypothetical protein
MICLPTFGATPNLFGGIRRNFDVLDNAPARDPVVNSIHDNVPYGHSLRIRDVGVIGVVNPGCVVIAAVG